MTTILLVEDEHEFRRTVRHLLERAGYSVLTAAEGAAALVLYHFHRPELVITDIFMPVKDGIELVRELRAIDPEAKIIAMSGGSRGELLYLELVRAFGVAAILEKPFRGEDLLSLVRRVLDT
jgi:CheY-like chemotaxis protein